MWPLLGQRGVVNGDLGAGALRNKIDCRHSSSFRSEADARRNAHSAPCPREQTVAVWVVRVERCRLIANGADSHATWP